MATKKIRLTIVLPSGSTYVTERLNFAAAGQLVEEFVSSYEKEGGPPRGGRTVIVVDSIVPRRKGQ